MGTYADPFALLNLENQEKENQQPALLEYAIEAYQIIRLKKMSVGTGAKREVIDTIYVQHGNPELAQSRAISKAEMLGDCMVVAKCEKVITSFELAQKSHEEVGNEL